MKMSYTDKNRAVALNLLFQVWSDIFAQFQNFAVENELNGVVIVQILLYMSSYYQLITQDTADAFIQLVETAYTNFSSSAWDFLKAPAEEPEELQVGFGYDF